MLRTLKAAATPPIRLMNSAFVPRKTLCPPTSTARIIAAIRLMRGSKSTLKSTAASATGMSSGYTGSVCESSADESTTRRNTIAKSTSTRSDWYSSGRKSTSVMPKMAITSALNSTAPNTRPMARSAPARRCSSSRSVRIFSNSSRPTTSCAPTIFSPVRTSYFRSATERRCSARRRSVVALS